jgi:pimeloyl-ACP methyl ester carboxylesterase
MGFLHLDGLGKVHFHEYGTGHKPMLAFHGYGMTGKQFHVLERSILKQYHVYGFDHFFHNESRLEDWDERQILSGMPKAMVKGYVERWFELHGRQRFSVMGYSIGANLALILVEEYADLIDEMILMAPDGLSVYKGFRFILHQPLGRWLFKHVTKSVWLAPFLLNMLKKIGFIDQSLYQIGYSEMDTPQKRLDVYYTLNLIRQLKPDTLKVAALINQHKISCKLIFGQHDNLFPKTAALPFIRMLDNTQVHELPLGHWLVIPALDEYLASFDI